jgi:hypothetical protein
MIAARRGDHRCAALGQPLGDRPSDATRGAGDERNLPRQIKHAAQCG